MSQGSNNSIDNQNTVGDLDDPPPGGSAIEVFHEKIQSLKSRNHELKEDSQLRKEEIVNLHREIEKAFLDCRNVSDQTIREYIGLLFELQTYLSNLELHVDGNKDIDDDYLQFLYKMHMFYGLTKNKIPWSRIRDAMGWEDPTGGESALFMFDAWSAMGTIISFHRQTASRAFRKSENEIAKVHLLADFDATHERYCILSAVFRIEDSPSKKDFLGGFIADLTGEDKEYHDFLSEATSFLNDGV